MLLVWIEIVGHVFPESKALQFLTPEIFQKNHDEKNALDVTIEKKKFCFYR